MHLFPFLAVLLASVAVHHSGPPVQTAFTERSYSPGSVALLQLRGADRPLRVRVFRAGMSHRGPMGGAPVSGAVVDSSATSGLRVRVGSWPSGLYYAEVASPGGVWLAPFVVRPARLGIARVAVVL